MGDSCSRRNEIASFIGFASEGTELTGNLPQNGLEKVINSNPAGLA